MNECPLSADEVKNTLLEMGVDISARHGVAVSGGADSVALALLLHEICPIEAVTVDHGLRIEARQEALFVGKVMAQHGIPHTILTWSDEKPLTGVQAAARNARYELMEKWCHEREIKTLFLAHHMDDQAETFLMRLSRGSGVYGLASMSPASPLLGRSGTVNLFRPLLSIPKTRLQATLKAKGIAWIEDPGNQNVDYDRVKVRRYLSGEPLLAIDSRKLVATAKRMQRAKEALDFYAGELNKTAVKVHDEGYATLDVAALGNAPEEVGLRALSRLVRCIGGAEYSPRMEKLERAYKNLMQSDFKGQTLCGCQFSFYGEGMLITREPAALLSVVHDKGGLWDNRFLVKKTVEGQVKMLGERGWQQIVRLDKGLKNTDIPFKARLTLPALWQDDQVIAQPNLSFGQGLSVEFMPKYPL